MKHESNDVKQLTAQIATFIAKSTTTPPLGAETLKVLIPMLVAGSKEKNAAVKSFSENALVTVLHLRHDESTLQARFLDCRDRFEISLDLIIITISRFAWHLM